MTAMPNNTTSTTPGNKSKRGHGMGMSLELAEVVNSWANWILIAALLVGVAATYAIVVSSKIKENALKRDLAVAQAAGETAHAEAAKANERAAGLEKEAAALRFQLDQEIQKRAQRLLSDEQKATMKSELKGKIREINVVVQRDIEARAFALQLEMVFSAAEIIIHPYELPPGDVFSAPAGLLMYSPGGETDVSKLQNDPLYRALKKVGLAGGTTSKPFATLELSPVTPLLPIDTYTVYVGQKSPF